jgi:outer membrane protein assembly factor BamB
MPALTPTPGRAGRRAVLVLMALMTGAVLTACSSGTDTVGPPIATYHGNGARTGYTANSSITPANAAGLVQRWKVSSTAVISAQPIVANSIVYWGDWNGYEHATSVAGKALWSRFVGTAPKPRSCPFPLGNLGVTSTSTVGTVNGRAELWVGGGGAQLYGLDASDGSVLWHTKLGAPPENTLWSSPALLDGSIYEGVASWNDCPGVVYGKVFRVNAATGAIQAVFSPERGHCVGGGIWSSPTVDAAEHAIYVTTGNDDCDSSVQNSIFKLNATTFAVESHWQTPKNPLVTDADFGATPTLFMATVGGSTRSMVGAEAKDGVYYAFDRADLAAGPVWTYVVEDRHSLTSKACLDLNTISSSAWAGAGAPVVVAGLRADGSSCVGTVTALNPASGAPEWQTVVQGPILGAVTEAPGLVAVGAATELDVLASKDGGTLFRFPEPKSTRDTGHGYGEPYWFWAPPTFSGSALYAVNEDGTLRSFRP